MKVCRQACADEFIQKFPEKYNTFIEQGGTNVSGGQKQRLCIARALAVEPEVILMDEPFKSLDYKTKYLIIKELKSIFQKEDRMVIFVTHDVDEAIFMEGNIYVLGGRPFEIKGVFKEQLEENKKNENKSEKSE